MKDRTIVAEGLAAYTIERRFGWERHRPDGAPPWDKVRTMWSRVVLGEMDELNGAKSALLDLYNQRLKEAEGIFAAEQPRSKFSRTPSKPCRIMCQH